MSGKRRTVLLPTSTRWKKQNPAFTDITDLCSDEIIHVVVPRFGGVNALYRFSTSRSLYVFGSENPLRRLSICLVTSQWFDWIVIAIILTNCVFIALKNPPHEAEYVFGSLYTTELVIKVIARGFVLQQYAYLKDRWNWLDFAVVLIGWLSLLPTISSLSGLHSLRVIRALRPIAAFRGLRVIVNTIVRSLRTLVDVMILVLFFVLLTALTGMQLMEGGLRNKCVILGNNQNQTDMQDLQRYAANSSNWYMPEGEPILCGNATGAQQCAGNETIVCLPNAGGNPNNGYTNFDNIGWAMLAAFQLITMDFWEDLYSKVLFAYGWKYVIYFVLVIFVGSCYAINLTLAVVAFSYEQESRGRSGKKTHKTFQEALLKPGNCVVFGPLVQHRKSSHGSYQATIPNKSHQNASGTAHQQSSVVSRMSKKVSTTSADFNVNIIRMGPDSCSSSRRASVDVPQFDFDLTPKRRAKNKADAMMGAVANMLRDSRKSTNPLPSEQRDSSLLQYSSPRCRLLVMVKHKAFEWTVTGCIILNTVLMAIQHPRMNKTMEQVSEIGNSIFTLAFAAEMLLKITALGPKKYAKDRWNLFDGLVVVVSLMELTLFYSQILSTRALSVIRTFRLLRVLKLAHSWSTMRTLMNVLASSFTGLFKVSVILIIVIYIFAVVGIHLFGDSYDGNVRPRWNFNDFPHAVMVVFRILCGEWIELLYQTLDTNHPALAIPFFIAVVIIGNLIAMNLFVALLLGAFEAEALRRSPNSENMFTRLRRRIVNALKLSKKVAPEPQHRDIADDTADVENRGAVSTGAISQRRKPGILRGTVCKPLRRIQQSIHSLVTHTYFEFAVLLIILASSVTLIFEDSKLRFNPGRKHTLKILNITFTTVFVVEVLLKWIGLGLKTFFSSTWNWVDFTVVTVSVVTLMPFSNDRLIAIQAIRSLRGLRPLRTIPRWKRMKIVVTALMRSVPEMGNVLLVCLLFWLIFSVIGVQTFGGKFYKCVDDDGIRLNATIVATRNDCLILYGQDHWVNSRINFDHIGAAAVALFQVATFEGWIELMADSVDAVDIDKQPKYDNNFTAYLFFVAFIMVGSVVLLNLFIGVIVENFSSLRKQYEESSTVATLLTPEQKKLMDALKRVGMKKPKRTIPEPKNRFLKICYDVAISTKFDGIVVFLIVSNVVVMSIQHYGQSATYDFALTTANYVFTCIFALDVTTKLLGLRQHYFYDPWNVFDFIIIILSLLGIALEADKNAIAIDPTALRPVRVFRMGRVLRAIKVAKGLRRLLFTYLFSLPAIINVGALLFTIMFIYAVIGMAMFGTVRHTGGINDINNFETFGNAISLLFRLATGAGWNEILDPCMIQPPYCNQTKDDLPLGDCGQPVVAIMYFTSYVLITSLLIINVYVAIFLDNYYQSQQEFMNQLGEDHIEMYYTQWAEIDPSATQFIKTSQLSSFIRTLPSPLIPLNTQSIDDFTGTLDTPIYEGDRVHCLDLLLSLIINYHCCLTGGQLSDEDLKLVTEETEKRFKEMFPARDPSTATSTVSGKWKAIRSAIVIQRAFRKHIGSTG